MIDYNLFLDDERIPTDVSWIVLPKTEWITVRSHNEFVNIIEKLGLPKIISFDHDLADPHYPYNNKLTDGTYVCNYDKYTEKTGYHSAKWLVEYCHERNLNLPEFYIHTLNTVGRENIKQLLNNYSQSR